MKYALRRGRRIGTVGVALVAITAAVTMPAAAIPPSSPGSGPSAAGSGPSQTPRTPLDSGSSAPQLPKEHQGVVPGQVLLTLDPATSVTGGALTGNQLAARAPQTNNAHLNAALHAMGATSLRPVLPSLSQAAASSATGAAVPDPNSGVSALARTYVVHTKDQDSAALARSLRGTPGVAHVEPNRYVNTMNTGARPLPSAQVRAAAAASAAKTSSASAKATRTGSAADAVPANYDLASSAQALLNAGGVDAMGAYAMLSSKYGQLPGAGEIITNVSIGDLVDQSMVNPGNVDAWETGATTMLQGGQRYLDLPSMPLIPTYVAGPNGSLNGSASAQGQDPTLGEVMLDFGVMAPLPHDQQRPGRAGSGYRDMLGVAPGATYRLVVPQQPTMDQIAGALLAAANQSPRPNVITASLGWGTDVVGFPSRYLEDDPVIHNVVDSIVQRDHIVVSISSNDGTRLFTGSSVGPDGGSTPTNTARNAAEATSIDDDAFSTTPTKVPDSGAIAAGGTTLDDTLAAPAGRSTNGTVAETRISGFGSFSSGFGSRIDLSAPSDNILAFTHPDRTGFAPPGGPSDVNVVLNGGTSASAPEIAAAAAVVLQASRLAGHHLTPEQVRTLLESTGRVVPSPAQIDQTLHVGPQIDVTAATEAALGDKSDHDASPAIVRLSIAHRVTRGALGGVFLEETDQNRIDLGDAASGGNGEGLVGPVTFAGDVTGLPSRARPQYTLTVGSTVWRSSHPAIRVTPRQLLAAAHLPVVSTADRTIQLDYRVLLDGRVRAGVRRTLAIGPSDGRYVEATAPQAPAVAPAGQAVTVHYDLTGVTRLSNPELVVSGVGHWNPILAPVFDPVWHQQLTAASGTVTIPASAFDGSGGIYGIGISQITNSDTVPLFNAYGEFAPIRIQGSSATDRPAAPVITGTDGAAGHSTEANRARPAFSLAYDVRSVPGAKSAEVEFSAPAPVFSPPTAPVVQVAFNTFINANGTTLDNDGVDTPSTAHFALPAASGTVRLDGLHLGLPTSAYYNVRVLAVDRRGRIVGQTSPSSMLAFDDGLPPDGSIVNSFTIAGKDSLAALATAEGGTEIRHYAPATGTYGAVLTADAGAGPDYEVLGVAAGTHRALLVHQATKNDGVSLETWNTATDTLVGRLLVPAGYSLVAGKVDPARNRAVALIGNPDPAKHTGSALLPIDLSTGAGAPLIPLPSPELFPWALIDVDSGNGDVTVMPNIGISNCFGSITVPRVDLTTRTVTSAGATSQCSHGLASDGSGNLYNLWDSLVSQRLEPKTVLSTINAAGDSTGKSFYVRMGVPDGMVLDGKNQLAVVEFSHALGVPFFGSAQGWIADNNSTSQLAIVDLKTGQLVKQLSGFIAAHQRGNFIGRLAGNDIQLDPATRTGWMIGSLNAQIRQFSY